MSLKNFKLIPLASVLLFVAGLQDGFSQIEVAMNLSDNRIIQNEPIYATVSVTNNSGKPIKVGNIPNWLDIDVNQKVDGVAIKTGSLVITDGVEILPGKTLPIPIRVDELYQLSSVSRYTIQATLRVNEWNTPFAGKESYFDVVKGTTIWSKAYSSPGLKGLNGQKGVFTYNLVTNVGAGRRKLLFQIKDSDPVRILRTVPVVKMISFSKPEAMIDPASNLHILCQYGRTDFTYNIYSPTGDLILRLTYRPNPAKPYLYKNAEGIIEVRGGKRIPSETDYLPKSFESDNDAEKK